MQIKGYYGVKPISQIDKSKNNSNQAFQQFVMQAQKKKKKK